MNFFLGKDPVGHFCCRAYPASPGVYKYSPYRGPGHAAMAYSIRRGEFVICWFVRRGERFEIEVTGEMLVGIPRRPYWVLGIAALRRAEQSATEPHPVVSRTTRPGASNPKRDGTGAHEQQ